MSHTEGGCHCGQVKFRIKLPEPLLAQRCNCSMCRACGFVHLIIPGRDFELLQGEQAISEYRFNTGTAKHLFCRHCGVKSYYVPRSNPDGYSINLNCLPDEIVAQTKIEEFDGRNWEKNAADLRHLSE